MVALRTPQTPRTPSRRLPPQAAAGRLARALSGALLAGAALAPPALAAPADDEARRHFRAGVNLLEDPEGARYEEAYQEFKTAYEIAQEPKILGNVALCAMKLERDGEAIEAYQRYLQVVPDVEPEERAQVLRDLQTLGAGLVRISIGANAPGVRLLDTRLAANGRKVVNLYGPSSGRIELSIHAGHHILIASAPGRADATWEFSAAAGAREEHTFVLPAPKGAADARPRVDGPEERPGRAPPLAPWLLAGVGSAAAAGGAVAGIIALRKEAALVDKCPQNLCSHDVAEADRRSLRATANLSTGLLVGGGALAAVGLGWLLFGPSGSPDRPAGAAAAPPARAAFGGACAPQGCVGTLRLDF
jgi:hypothetical protein